MQILIVDNVRFTGELIAGTLRSDPAVQTAEVALDIEQAQARMAAHSYDVLLINGALPDGAALELTRDSAESYPQTRVLVYGLENLDTLHLSYCEAGAVGCLSGENTAGSLLKVVHAAANGEAYASPQLTRLLMARMAELTARLDDMAIDPERYDKLSARQKEVLHLMTQGLTNEEIAARLIVAISTVKNHVHNILDKLNLSGREDAAAYLLLVQAGQ